MSMSGPRVVPVLDVFGRQRAMSVQLSEEKQIVLGVPPGEAVFMKVNDIEQLIGALRDTRAEALRGQRWT